MFASVSLFFSVTLWDPKVVRSNLVQFCFMFSLVFGVIMWNVKVVRFNSIYMVILQLLVGLKCFQQLIMFCTIIFWWCFMNAVKGMASTSATLEKMLLSYNKDHGTSSLKKYIFNEHLEVYKRRGLFLLQKMAKNVNERQVAIYIKSLLGLQLFLVIINLIPNLAQHNMILWRT